MPLIHSTERGMARTRLKTVIGILVALAALLTVLGFFAGDRLKAQEEAAPEPRTDAEEESNP